MKTILYIHGLKVGESSGESRTATVLREELSSREFTLIAPSFPRDGELALKLARDLITQHQVDIVVASSLGGFICLCLRGVKRVVVNPCIRPDIELPKRNNADIANSYKGCIEAMWDNLSAFELEQTIGVFSDKDELFSYENDFLRHYTKSIKIQDGHRISPKNVREVIAPLIRCF